MKNLYYYMILLLVCVTSFGQQVPQNQNAVWLFGNQAGLNFLPDPENPTAITTSTATFFESCATVSDQNGNLLFYTNGVSVWDDTQTLLTNGDGTLLSNVSNTQGAVIIPRPNHDTFYLATVSGITGGGRGIFYSEIDINNNEVMSGVLNIPLQDNNNSFFNPAGGNICSEKLTSTIHANGTDYWLVSQIADQVCSYLVTENGINPSPITSQAPLNLQTSDPLDVLGVGQMKISPNTLHIAICYFNRDIETDEYGAIAIGDFDYNNGQVVFRDYEDDGEAGDFLIQIDDEFNFYGVEFSPNSDYVYFTTQTNVNVESSQRTLTTNDYYSSVYSVDVAKKTAPTLIYKSALIPEPIDPMDAAVGLQLAINGRIYAASQSPNTPFISVINNPNDNTSPNFVGLSVPVSGQPRFTLPQWVHNHTLDICPTYITLNTEPHTLHTYEFSNFIVTNSNYSISDGQDITLQAGNFIVLDPNTYIFKGGICLAHIDDCGEIIGSSTSSSRMAMLNDNENDKLSTTGLTLFPNPTNDFVEINYQKGISNIIVTSIDGKTIYQGTVNNTAYTLDTKTFTEGIYLVSIQTNEGDIITKKLVVK